MGQLSLKKLVELTGYVECPIVSVATDCFPVGDRGVIESGGEAVDKKQQQQERVFSHRRAMRVV